MSEMEGIVWCHLRYDLGQGVENAKFASIYSFIQLVPFFKIHFSKCQGHWCVKSQIR